MALGTFTPPAGGKAGSFDPRQHAGKPLIVVVREFREDFATKRFPTPKDVVICDIVDILADTVHVSVIWGSAAIVDRVKGYTPKDGETPEKLPVQIVKVAGATGNEYCTLEPLDGKALELAAAWDAKNGARIDEARAEREAMEKVADSPKGPAPDATPPASAALSEADLEAAIAGLK